MVSQRTSQTRQQNSSAKLTRRLLNDPSEIIPNPNVPQSFFRKQLAGCQHLPFLVINSLRNPVPLLASLGEEMVHPS